MTNTKFRISLVILTFFVMWLFSHCAVAPTHGLIYTETVFPGEFNPHADIKAKRYAKGCQFHLFGMVSMGDAGAGSIARKNEIRRIATIDHSFTGFLFPVFGKYCTIVGGD